MKKKAYAFKHIHQDDVAIIQKMIDDIEKDVNDANESLVGIFLERTLFLQCVLVSLMKGLKNAGIIDIKIEETLAVCRDHINENMEEYKKRFFEEQNFLETISKLNLGVPDGLPK